MIVELDLVGNTSLCRKDCPAHIYKWVEWAKKQIAVTNLALLPVEVSYRESLDSKSRYMLRKVEKLGYSYKSFNYNDELEAIYDINTSKPFRQGQRMSPSYLTKPKSISIKSELCQTHDYVWLGGYKRGVLRAYCALAVVNELAILNTIIGHASSLPDGVMNGLINYLNDYCLEKIPTVRYINYLSLESSKEGLASFKRSVGFESYEVLLRESV